MIHEIEKTIGEPYKIERMQSSVNFLGIDKDTKEQVSFTIIPNLFSFYSRTSKLLQDIHICAQLRHENIARLINIKTTNHFDNQKSLIVVLETLDTDLHQIIFSPQELTEDHRRFFIYQILRGLKYLHSANITHKNLNPTNIFINSSCEIKIQIINTEIINDKIVYRWHKAPETFLSNEEKNPFIDIWSVGCIFCEILLRKPLFTGNTTLNQLEKIVNTIGSPKDDDLFYVSNQKALDFMNSLQKVNEVDWNNLIPNGTSDEIDLIKMMLAWNPTKRISAEEALKHHYFEVLHDSSDEPCASKIDFLKIDPEYHDFQNFFWNEIQKIREINNFK